jgi:hypothetical protein
MGMGRGGGGDGGNRRRGGMKVATTKGAPSGRVHQNAVCETCVRGVMAGVG